MKEIIAVIRPGKDKLTKAELDKIGCSGSLTRRVYGRGKQRGLKYQTQNSAIPMTPQEVVMRYLPKKMISIMVPDSEVKKIVEAIMKANRTGEYGDGKIFILPAGESYRIRTKQAGEEAIQ